MSDPIRRQVGNIFGFLVPSGMSFAAAFKELDRSGGLTQRRLNNILVAICEKVEEMENGRESDRGL